MMIIYNKNNNNRKFKHNNKFNNKNNNNRKFKHNNNKFNNNNHQKQLLDNHPKIVENELYLLNKINKKIRVKIINIKINNNHNLQISKILLIKN